MAEATNSSAAKGAIWSTIDKFGIVAMQFVINVVLARLLTPDDFGLVGMILIIVAVSIIVAEGGFSSALIQKSDASEEDYSTSFYVNITMSALLYVLIYILAPLVAKSLGYQILCDFLRVISVTIILSALGVVARVKLKRKFAFKQIAISNIVAYILAATVAIVMSREGFGAWSLVAMHITNALFSNIFIIIAARWTPSTKFSFDSLKRLFAYGEYMLISEILSNACFHIQSILVGKYFSPYTAGQYAQAKKIEEVAGITLPIAMVQVLFPLYSRLQHDITQMRETLRRNNKLIAFTIFPLLTLLAIIAKPLILFLFGDRWIEAIQYFQVLCIGGIFSSLHYFNYYAVAAIGRSRILLITGLFRSIFLIIAMFICVHISMKAVLIAMVLSNIVDYLTNAIIASKYIRYRVIDQIVDILPILLISLALGAVIYCIYSYYHTHWLVLSIIYMTMYIVINYTIKSKTLLDIVELIKHITVRH